MRPATKLEILTYGDCVAKRLRELREEHKLTMDQFRARLAELGVHKENGDPVPYSTAYSWERGPSNRGVELPIGYFPVIARMYGFSSPAEWLPTKGMRLTKKGGQV